MISNLLLTILVFTFSFIISTTSYATDNSMPPKNPKAQVTQPPAANASGEYGETKFNIKNAKSVSSAVNTDTDVVIKTTVTEVCPKKGCWMKVQGATSNDQIRVTFKDYGFFVPTELVGKEVALQGKYVKHTESIDEQKHLLKDAKRPQSEIDAVKAPKETLRFISTGVKEIL